MKLTVITTDNTDPYVNLAAEEALSYSAADDAMILFLWQNAHTVVIGRNQNPWRECEVEKIKRDGVYLARRLTGGGAVYHDMGNLNFTFIAGDGLYDIGRQTDVILLACRLMGIEAQKTGRNDLTVSGRKFSGHAYCSHDGRNVHHGTLMLDVSPEDLTKYLSVPDDKLKSKGVASVRSRVTNLMDHIPHEKLDEICEAAGLMAESSAADRRAAAVEAMKDALIRAAEREYGCAAERSELKAIPEELIARYSSEEWRLGTKIPFSKEIRHRFEWGGVEVQLAMKGEYIESCKVYSDALETDVFAVIEDLLTGCRYDAAAIRELADRLPAGTSAIAHEILGIIASQV